MKKIKEFKVDLAWDKLKIFLKNLFNKKIKLLNKSKFVLELLRYLVRLYELRKSIIFLLLEMNRLKFFGLYLILKEKMNAKF